jgi:recombination protein RecT
MSNEVANAKKTDITTRVMAQIKKFQETGELLLPANYSAENAIKGAQLHLLEVKDKNGQSVLESCTVASVATSLTKMVTQGLSVIKGQCYFIAYGTTLNFQRSYQGSIALSKRVAEVKTVVAQVVYEGEDFAVGVDVNTGFKKVLKHVPDFAKIDNTKIVGAYAIVQLNDGNTFAEIMNIAEITQSWKQGQGYGKSNTHKDFAQEMSKKTVINRACKNLINQSDDAHLFFGVEDDGKDAIDRKNDETEDIELMEVSFEEPKAIEKEIVKEIRPETVDFPKAIDFPDAK